MNSKSSAIRTAHNQLFVDCKQGRGKNAVILSKIVLIYDNDHILVNNGKWNAGKTTFVIYGNNRNKGEKSDE